MSISADKIHFTQEWQILEFNAKCENKESGNKIPFLKLRFVVRLLMRAHVSLHIKLILLLWLIIDVWEAVAYVAYEFVLLIIFGFLTNEFSIQ